MGNHCILRKDKIVGECLKRVYDIRIIKSLSLGEKAKHAIVPFPLFLLSYQRWRTLRHLELGE